MNTLLMHAHVVLTLCVLAVPPCIAADDDPLARARGIYDTELRKIRAQHAARVQTFPARYTKALLHTQREMQQAGDLDGWQAVNREIGRYREASHVAAEHIDAEAPVLADVQRSHVAMWQGYETELFQSVLNLRDRYVQHLEGLQRTLTQQGNITAALKTREEIQRVDGGELVTRALAWRDGDGAPDQPIFGDEVAAGGDAEPAAQPAEEMQDGVRVYRDASLELQKDIVYKSSSLRRTEATPLSGFISMQTWVGAKRQTSQERDVGSYYSTTARSTSEDRYVRMAVRSSRVDLERRDLTVVAQFFVRTVSSTRGSSSAPSESARYDVRIHHLTTEPVTMDFPAVSVGTSSYSYSSYYDAGSSRYGQKFYGFGVTVFSDAGELLYQGVSTRGLEDHLIDRL